MTHKPRGFTLIELIVAVGLFAIVMTLAAGAYLVVVSINRNVQGTMNGMNNLSFALDTMTRAIRTGTNYSCGGGDCARGNIAFTFTDQRGRRVTYMRSAVGTSTKIAEFYQAQSADLTDSSVSISSLLFYVTGTGKPTGDYVQPNVRILISGTVSAGPGTNLPFTVETSATMRGTDI